MLLPTPFVATPTWRYRHAQLTDTGLLHPGYDLYHPNENEVIAAAAGRVRFAGPARGWGTLVVIEHNDGLTSRYGHMRNLQVREDQLIEAGVVVGTVGDGRGQFSRHLHYDILDTMELWKHEGKLNWLFYEQNLGNFARIYRDPREFHPEINNELTGCGW